MVKFPSQNILTYQTGDISYSAYASAASGGTTGHLNLPKDLSALNRRGYGSTDNKGVPWVFRTKFDFFLHDEDGAKGPPSVLDNLMVTLKITGTQNTWVMKNAAVKFHAARNAMWKKAGVKKGDLGAYAGAIRYNFDAASDSWLTPIDGNGDAFVGGTWDISELYTESDSSGFQLALVGTGINESTSNTGTVVSIGHSYLASRATVPGDSNLESSATPADFSILNELLRPVSTSGVDDDIIDDAQDAQDNPPYDQFIPSDTNNDVTETVELGRCLSSTQAAVGSCVVDIPFGICDLTARAYTSESTSGVDECRGLVRAEVLSIYPMQG